MSELKEEKETKEPLKVKAKRPSNLGTRKEDPVFKLKMNKDKKEEEVEKTPEAKEEKPVETKKDNLITKVTNDIASDKKESVTEKAPVKAEIEMPDGVKKLISFMKDTGGDLTDYARLNIDYSTIKDEDLLKEFYKKTKPHLDDEEVKFLLTDKFSFDENEEDEKSIRKKKLAMKEEVANASSFMNNLKEQYYEDIKLKSSSVSPDQQKALDFFNRYNKEQDAAAQRREVFKQNTNEYFSEDFEGFDFSVGEDKFKYGVSNPNAVADKQADLSTFIGKFLDKDGNVNDTAGYHKAIYAARNADTIAEHFYEQGKADAIKDLTSKSNNVSSSARPSQGNGEIFINGLKVKAINGTNSSKLKIKSKTKN